MWVLEKFFKKPVGTAKLLHVIAPYYFPLIDNNIAKAAGLTEEGRSITPSDYINWMRKTGMWLMNYSGVIKELESKLNSSILKLLDECLYIMSSVELSLRIKELGLDL